MRFPAALVLACLSAQGACASTDLTPDEAAAMKAKALAAMSPSHVQGRFDFMLDDPDLAVDQLTGRGSGNPYDDCANTPVRTKRDDGSTIIKRVDVCD